MLLKLSGIEFWFNKENCSSNPIYDKIADFSKLE